MKDIKVKTKNIKEQSLLSVGKSIVEGTYNLYKNNNKDISKERLSICSLCPLLKKSGSSLKCNRSKYIIRRTYTEVSNTSNSNESIAQGCGCNLQSKSTVVGNGNTCPANNWDNVELENMCIPSLDVNQLKDDKFYQLIKTYGITSTCYSLKLNLSLKLLSSINLKKNGFIKQDMDEFYTFKYIKEDYTLFSFIDGTYKVNKDNNEILSRDRSKVISIQELYNILEI